MMEEEVKMESLLTSAAAGEGNSVGAFMCSIGGKKNKRSHKG